jgi:hypothetical protein
MNLATLGRDEALTLSAMWLPHLERVVARGMANGPATLAEIQGSVQTVHLIWDGPRHVASVGTRIIHDINNNPCGQIVWCGGEGFPAILDVMPDLEAHARAAGCVRLLVHGRLGWKRGLAQHGLRPREATYVKELA